MSILPRGSSIASFLRAVAGTVKVSSSPKPEVGDTLVAISESEATWATPPGAYSDEQARDAIGAAMLATATIMPGYDDPANALTWNVRDQSITFAKLQPVTNDRLLGRTSAGAGPVEELALGGGLVLGGGVLACTVTQYTDELVRDTFAAALVDSGAIAWTIDDFGDTFTADIINGGVTFAKMAPIATDRLIGRDTAGTGSPEALTVSGGLEFSGAGGIRRSALAGGDATAAAGSNVVVVENVTVPGAAADTVPYFTAIKTLAVATFNALGRSLVGAASQAAARAALALDEADTVRFAGGTFTGDLQVDGNLQVNGAVIESTTSVVMEGRYIYQNAGYTTPIAQTSGQVVNYLPGFSTTVNGWAAGVAGVSNPVVLVASGGGFSAGDFVTCDDTEGNGGFFEVFQVLSGPARLELRGVGLNGTVEDWTRNQVQTVSAVGIVKIACVSVTVTRVGIDGLLERASGSSVGLTFSDLYYVGGADVAAADGGTGHSTYVVGDMLVASGAAALARLAGVATGSVLRSGGVGALPAWGAVALATDVSGSLPAANGGTGLMSYAIGDLLVAAGTANFARLAAVATGSVLRSGGIGVSPAWGPVDLTADVTGTLPVAKGGTGQTTSAPPQCFAKDVDPDAVSVALGATVILQVGGVDLTWDAGAAGCFASFGGNVASLPGPGGAGSQAGLRVTFSDGTTADLTNATGAPLNVSAQQFTDLAVGSLGAGNAKNSGKTIRKVSVIAKNNAGTNPLNIDLGNVSLRFMVLPCGSGAAI